MNYLTLITQFWRLRRSKRITSTQADLYYCLLQESNERGWENPLEYPNIQICARIGISEPTLIDARTKLKELGLIDVQAGERKVRPPMYTILSLNNLSMITSKSRGKSYAKTEDKPSKKHNIISKQKHKQKNPPLSPEGEQPAAGDTWRCSFEIYKNELLAAFNALVRDTAFISEQEQLNPNVDIPRTLQKACKNFWGTGHGWENKKQKPDDKIDWPFTLAGSISQSQNRIYKTNNASQSKQLTTINLNSESELNDLFIAWAHVTEGHYRYRNDATTKYIEKGYTHLISIGQKKYVGRIKQQ